MDLIIEVIRSIFLFLGGIIMRSKAPPSVDKSHFTRTAVATKAVNLRQIIYRGGMRF